ncbi:hypothetical protein HRI_001289000 [Hibiscus trionum]|uniref:Reverse transcriptase domain-containing protein n=1 Tax=Hibiscus trionum TaxID=183268 RepID=A0A9W7HFX5_HIBTR|nr:hypothetical protein HRI_001289000 [Hibiscus trionum]
MVIFMEPRISDRKADTVIASLGFPNSHRVEAVDFVGGICIAWYDTVTVEILLNHFQFIHCRVTAKKDGRSILVTSVYVSPHPSQRKIIWPHLRHLASAIHSPWVLFGDFNATLTTMERKGGAATTRPSKDFQAFVFDYGLRDMGYSSPDFTWSKGNTFVRLDRFICNSYWDEAFPEANVEHLFRLRSDHRLILLNVGHSRRSYSSGTFRYFTGWQTHEDFARMVCDNWIPSASMSETLIHFSKAADNWNKTIFDFIGTKKKILMARLKGIQISLATRKQKNKVTSLKLQDGTWCEEDDILLEEASRFFENLFSKDNISHEPFLSTVTYPELQPELVRHLQDVPSDDEIHAALSEMAPLKSPGWDGLHVEFFQRQWPIVGASVCRMIHVIFRGERLEASINRTIIVLIPKNDRPEAFSGFRPINLCTVLYKLLTKVVARRLKPLFPLLICPNQTSFIAGRSIVDNIIVNQEAIHSMRTAKNKQGWMAIKVDLEKAFDRLQWDFIEDSMLAAGFPPGIRRIIMDCISSSGIQVQWNGKLSRLFHPSQGIRQGDPLSPYLFVLAMERLGHLISASVQQGCWHPYRFTRNDSPLSHLFFANGLILYARADIQQAQIINEILTYFGAHSGHRVSKPKTHIYFSPNTNPDLQQAISSFLGYQRVESLGKYLGVLVLHQRLRCADYDFIVDKMKAKLSGWATRTLSMVGRITYAKSVLSAIPFYFIQTSMLPKKICNTI